MLTDGLIPDPVLVEGYLERLADVFTKSLEGTEVRYFRVDPHRWHSPPCHVQRSTSGPAL